MENTDTTGIGSLTEREVQILRYVSEGYNTYEIAAKVNLTHNTICTHRKNILRKTGAKNIISVIILAIQRQVIQLDSLTAMAA